MEGLGKGERSPNSYFKGLSLAVVQKIDLRWVEGRSREASWETIAIIQVRVDGGLWMWLEVVRF